MENKICPLTIAVFVKFHSDMALLTVCQDIFKELTQNPSCIGPLQTRIIPTLTSMMTVTPMDKSKDGTLLREIDLGLGVWIVVMNRMLCPFQRDLGPWRWTC